VTAPATVGVVGLGLIGGSLARALGEAGHRVLASTRADEARTDAAAEGIEVVDDPADLVEPCDVVVLAVPLPVMAEVMGRVGRALATAPEGTAPTLTDVGSVKRGVAAAAATLADPSVVVPGHPLAGTEHVGWGASDAGLFRDTRWALAVDEPVDLARWATVARVALATGADVVPVTVAEHDAAVALTSHLPYVLAATVAGVLDGTSRSALARSLAAGSFRDVTRVAGGHPTLGAEMATANREPLQARIAHVRAVLRELDEALSEGDSSVVEGLFRAGHDGRTWLDRRGHDDGPATEVELDRDGLVDLGRSGGRVVAVADAAPGGGTVTVTVVSPEVAR
jgi:prephenate dehydrogenase